MSEIKDIFTIFSDQLTIILQNNPTNLIAMLLLFSISAILCKTHLRILIVLLIPVKIKRKINLFKLNSFIYHSEFFLATTWLVLFSTALFQLNKTIFTKELNFVLFVLICLSVFTFLLEVILKIIVFEATIGEYFQTLILSPIQLIIFRFFTLFTIFFIFCNKININTNELIPTLFFQISTIPFALLPSICSSKLIAATINHFLAQQKRQITDYFDQLSQLKLAASKQKNKKEPKC